jgi:signal transduction histidine kinase
VLKFRGVIDVHTHPFTEETVAGQGMGLAVVRGIVGRHRGTLALAESELGGLKATVRVQ